MQTLTLRSPAAFAVGYNTEELWDQIGCISTYASLLGTWLQDGDLELIEHNEPEVIVRVHNQHVVPKLQEMEAIM